MKKVTFVEFVEDYCDGIMLAGRQTGVIGAIVMVVVSPVYFFFALKSRVKNGTWDTNA